MCLWVLLAALLTLYPSRRNHWPQAYFLAALGLPLLCWIYVAHGLLVGGVASAVMLSVLRWPAYYFVKRLRGRRQNDDYA